MKLLDLVRVWFTAARYPRFCFWYRGTRHYFTKDTSLEMVLYRGCCPQCHRELVIDPQRHRIFEEEQGMTLNPSLVCAYDDCSWHIMVRKGNGSDCGCPEPACI